MMSNGSSVTTVISPAEESISSSRLLSSSISSLSGSGRHASSHLSKTYRHASTLFLTRRLSEALSTLEPIIAPERPDDDDCANGDILEPAPVANASRTSRIKVWSLYLTLLDAIVNLGPEEGKEAFGTRQWRDILGKVRDGGVWDDVVRDGYHGIEGDVDADVIINLWVQP